jgi:UMF1 family MFS transporter
MIKLNKNALLWALYDFSNSIFLTVFLIIYFPQWLLNEKNFPDVVYAVLIAVVTVITGIFLPALGALSDLRGYRLRFFRIFVISTWLASLLTATAANLVPGLPGVWLAIVFFAAAFFSFQPTLVLYDALLPQVIDREHQAVLSGIGFIIGYLGQIVGLLVVSYFVSSSQGSLASSAFFPTSCLFFLSARPTLIWLREPGNKALVQESHSLREAYVRVGETIKNIRHFKKMFYFILSYLLYSNAITTVTAFTVVYAEKVLGFTGQAKIPLYIAGTGAAIVGAFLSGTTTNYFGLSKILKATLFGWLGCFAFGAVATSLLHGWLLALWLGVLTGATFTISRLVVIELTSNEKLTEFFGFFGLAGRLATTVGPLWWGFVTLAFAFLGVDKYRIAVGSLSFFILIALVLLKKVWD